MKALRMVTCFLITCTFVLLLLIPGKAQASDLQGLWDVVVYGPPLDGETDPHEYISTWIVGLGLDEKFIFGASTWEKYPQYVDRLTGDVEGNKVTIVRYTIVKNSTYGGKIYVQTYTGTFDGDSTVSGNWTGNGARGQTWDWRATIRENPPEE
ncbi:MAG: hypothetical protein ACFFCW_39900 [Candidatus Hodarchaeota archaeon]